MNPVLAVLAACLAAVLSTVLTPAVIALAHRWQMLDHPGGRRVHAHAVPRLGGVAVFFAATIAAIALLAFSDVSGDRLRMLVGLFIAADILFLVGIIDDVRGVKPFTKVLSQVTAAGIVMYAGLLPTRIIVGAGIEFELGLLAVPLMVLWVLAVTNAFNLIDGLNGLASGIAVVACIGAGVVAVVVGRPVALVVVAALAGAILGFLPHNYPRARIFLGDSGSMSIGFMLACLLVYAPSRPADMAVPIALPLAAMVLPFLDTALAVTRRWLRGTSLSGADSRHVHHQLLALGLSPARATAALWAFSAVVLAFGILVVVASPRVVVATLMVGVAVLMAAFVWGASLLSYHELHVAADVLRTGFGRARKLISQQIHAVDVAQAIHRARTLEEVDDVLATHAQSFGFLGMKVVRDPTDRSHLHVRRRHPRVKSWRFEYELHPVGTDDDHYALNIWCQTSGAMQVYGAERVAKILAPAIELRLTAALHQTGELPVPQLTVRTGTFDPGYRPASRPSLVSSSK